MNYRNIFPFRIGSTSYVIPDSIIPNVILMSDCVDDIELLFFESASSTSLLSNPEIKELKQIAEKKKIRYSIHCPIDIYDWVENKNKMIYYSEQIRILYELTKSLPVSGYIVHLDGINKNSNVDQITKWKDSSKQLCTRINQIKDLDHSKICIENLQYNPLLNIGLVERFSFSYCTDIGHLWKHNYEWEKISKMLLKKTEIIHLHGVCHDKDHCSIKLHNQNQIDSLLSMVLKHYSNVLTIELFNLNELVESLEYLKELWEK